MALRLRRDVQKSSYYVWFLGAEEAKGLRGPRVISTALTYLVDQSNRAQEPIKVTLQISHKGIKIIQGSSKHFIPHSAITSSIQRDDIVACVLLLYNPVTKCPLHVHAYRCDSGSTAQALNQQLQTLINRLENQKRFEELETRLGLLPSQQLSSKTGLLAAECNEQQLPSPSPQSQSNMGVKSAQHYFQQQQQQQSHYQSQQQQLSHRNSGRKSSSELFASKRVGSSMGGGSDTGNSTHESECSDENNSGSSPIISPRSMQMHKTNGSHHHHQQQKYYHHHHPSSSTHQLPLQSQQHHHSQQQQTNLMNSNTDLFDSLAAELRAKLKGDGPPLLLPPRDYDTVHRSKGNLTAIELRRCRNALIVGNVGPTGKTVSPSTATGTGATTTTTGGHNKGHNTNTNVSSGTPTTNLVSGEVGGGGGGGSGNNGGKLISSRGSSGIGSDLAPSPERHETNSSSDDEHWTNEADNSVIALKPSQVALNTTIQNHSSHHPSISTPLVSSGGMISRKSIHQPPEDSYLRDLPQKPYPNLRNSSAMTSIDNAFEKDKDKEREKDLHVITRRHESELLFNKNKKSSTTNKWTREDEIKPIIVRPIDYDAKFNHIMQSEQTAAYSYTAAEQQEQQRSFQHRDKSPLKKKTTTVNTPSPSSSNSNANNNYNNNNGKLSTKNLLTKKKNLQNTNNERQSLPQDEVQSPPPHSSYYMKNKTNLKHNNDLMSSEEALPVNGKDNHHLMQYLNGKLGTGGSGGSGGSGGGNGGTGNNNGGLSSTHKKYGAKQRYVDPADLPFESTTVNHNNNVTTAINNGPVNNGLNIGRNKYAAIHKTPINYGTELEPELSINDFEINHNNSMKHNGKVHESKGGHAAATTTAATAVATGISEGMAGGGAGVGPTTSLTKSAMNHHHHASSPTTTPDSSNYAPPQTSSYPRRYPYHHSSFESIGSRELHPQGKDRGQYDNYPSSLHHHHSQSSYQHHNQERNPYREPESLPYIESMEKMMKSSALRFRPLQSDLMMPPPTANSLAINVNRDPKASKALAAKSYEKNEMMMIGGGDYEFTYNYGNPKSSSSNQLLSASNRSLTPLKDYTDDGGYVANDGAAGHHRPQLHRGNGSHHDLRRHHSRNWSDEDHMYDSPPPTPQLSASVNSSHHEDGGIMMPAGAGMRRSRSRNDHQWMDPVVVAMLDPNERLREKISSSEEAGYLSSHHGRERERHPCGGDPSPLVVSNSNHSNYGNKIAKGYKNGHREKSMEKVATEGTGRERSRGAQHSGRREYHSSDMEKDHDDDDHEEEEQDEDMLHLQQHHRHHHLPHQSSNHNVRMSRTAALREEQRNPSSGSGHGAHKAAIPQMPKGYRHSYAEPAAFPRSAGRVGLAAVNPY